MAISVGDAVLKLGVDTKDLDRGLQGIKGTIQKHQKAIGLAMAAAGGVILAGLALSIKAASDFEAAMREVNTMMGLSQEEFTAFSKEVQTLASDLGVSAVESANALYQAISAGIPKENAIEFLTIATKSAIGGITSTEIAVDGLSTVINAFKLPLSDTQKVADLMFKTVEGGKTTFEELSASLFQVAPIAAASGVSFEEISAAMATMTKQGVPTKIAVTQLRQAMVALQKPTVDMEKAIKDLGYESGQTMLEELGLAETLNALRDATGGSNQMLMTMFGSVEAGQAVLALTGDNAAMFASDLDAMANSAGAATDAFNEMEESASRQMTALKESAKSVAISIGNVLLPILTDILDIIKPIIKSIIDWTDENPKLTKVIVIGVGALGGLLVVLGSLLLLMPGITAAMTAFGISVNLSIWPITLIVAGIAALIAAGILLWKNWDKVAHFFQDMWSNIKIIFAKAVKFLVNTVLKPFLLYVDKVIGTVLSVLGKIVGFFNREWGAAIDSIANKLHNLDREITNWADTLIASEEVVKDNRDAQRELEEAVADATETTGESTAALEDNTGAMDDNAKAARGLEEALEGVKKAREAPKAAKVTGVAPVTEAPGYAGYLEKYEALSGVGFAYDQAVREALATQAVALEALRALEPGMKGYTEALAAFKRAQAAVNLAEKQAPYGEDWEQQVSAWEAQAAGREGATKNLAIAMLASIAAQGAALEEGKVAKAQRGGIAMRPLTVRVAEKIPEALIPLDRGTLEKLGIGGYRTANIYWMVDGREIARIVGQPLIDEVRLRTGVRI